MVVYVCTCSLYVHVRERNNVLSVSTHTHTHTHTSHTQAAEALLSTEEDETPSPSPTGTSSLPTPSSVPSLSVIAQVAPIQPQTSVQQPAAVAPSTASQTASGLNIKPEDFHRWVYKDPQGEIQGTILYTVIFLHAQSV